MVLGRSPAIVHVITEDMTALPALILTEANMKSNPHDNLWILGTKSGEHAGKKVTLIK